MPIRLDHTDADFEARFAAFLTTKREASPDVEAAVRDIIVAVRRDGDRALIDYTLRFDRTDLAKLGIAVTRAEIDDAHAKANPETVNALTFARDRIEAHHARQRPHDDRYTDALGVELG